MKKRQRLKPAVTALVASLFFLVTGLTPVNGLAKTEVEALKEQMQALSEMMQAVQKKLETLEAKSEAKEEKIEHGSAARG